MPGKPRPIQCILAFLKGKQKLKQLAKWLEQEYPSAASSLLEGLDKMFTINALGLPKTLRRRLKGSVNANALIYIFKARRIGQEGILGPK